MPKGLFALALAAFGIGLTEFGIVGLLPSISSEFNVTEQVAGYLVSGYAVSVAVGAILLTLMMLKLERKNALTILTGFFIIGNVTSALSSNYEMLLVGRIIAALCHGAFFSIGAVVASDMVEKNKKGAAISLMFAGLTISNVVGVPLGTFVGINFGWRVIFWVLSIIGVLCAIGIQTLIPKMGSNKNTNIREEVKVFSRYQVWISALLSVLSFSGVIGGFTYIAFTLTQVSGFSSQNIPWLLVLFGVGTFIGNIYGGKLADKSLNKYLFFTLLLLAIVMGGFSIVASSKLFSVICLLLMGALGLATAPGLQVRMMKFASDAPTVASGTNIAAFNIGNALGAYLCGYALSNGYGFSSPLMVGALLSLLASSVVILGSYHKNKKTVIA